MWDQVKNVRDVIIKEGIIWMNFRFASHVTKQMEQIGLNQILNWRNVRDVIKQDYLDEFLICNSCH